MVKDGSVINFTTTSKTGKHVEKLEQNFKANNVTAAKEKTNYILQQFTIG